MNLTELKATLLKDPIVKQHYEDIQPEFEEARKKIEEDRLKQTLGEGYKAREILIRAYKTYRAKLEELEYELVCGGLNPQNHWSVYVHPEFLELAYKHKTDTCLDTRGMEKELGLSCLPNGAILYGIE